MPKKTKKQKLLAQKHRTFQVPVPAPLTTESQTPGPTFQFTAPVINTHTQTTAAVVNEFDAIKRDIRKTLLLTTAIIVSEFLLSHYLPH